MPRESRKQQIHNATLAIVEKTCRLHDYVRTVVETLPEAGVTREALECLADTLAEHVEEVGSLAAVVDLSMTKVVITHFKGLASLFEPSAVPAAPSELPSADLGEVPDFDVVDDAEVPDAD